MTGHSGIFWLVCFDFVRCGAINTAKWFVFLFFFGLGNKWSQIYKRKMPERKEKKKKKKIKERNRKHEFNGTMSNAKNAILITRWTMASVFRFRFIRWFFLSSILRQFTRNNLPNWNSFLYAFSHNEIIVEFSQHRNFSAYTLPNWCEVADSSGYWHYATNDTDNKTSRLPYRSIMMPRACRTSPEIGIWAEKKK